jgi:methylated-DNA-[protein]-cysteine S-methyltransferase
MSSCPKYAPTSITPFAKLVYGYCKKIPKGKVSTYGELAKAMGKPKSSRAVGSALKKNPFAPHVPCHRVVASSREMGGFHGSTDLVGSELIRKRKMLRDEGVDFEEPSEHDKKRGNYKVSSGSVHHFA